MGIRTTKNKKTEGKKTKQNKWKVTFRSMPRCKPEPKESQSARRSLSRGHGLGRPGAPVLPPLSWTEAPARNWEARSVHQDCCEQGSGPCVTCQAPPCHPLRSSLTDHTRDVTWSWSPVSLPQWIHKSCEADDCLWVHSVIKTQNQSP